MQVQKENKTKDNNSGKSIHTTYTLYIYMLFHNLTAKKGIILHKLLLCDIAIYEMCNVPNCNNINNIKNFFHISLTEQPCQKQNQ